MAEPTTQPEPDDVIACCDACAETLRKVRELHEFVMAVRALAESGVIPMPAGISGGPALAIKPWDS